MVGVVVGRLVAVKLVERTGRIPQNVNFAISGTTARVFLNAHKIAYRDAAIVQRAALADALIDGRGVQELDAKGKAADEIKAVWRWIKRRI